MDVILLVVSALISGFATLKAKNRKIIFSALVTGFIITSLNTLIEYFSAEFDLYYVRGTPKILHTPLFLFVSWMLLAYSFCIFALWKKAYIKFIIPLAIFGGITLDYIGSKFSILSIGERGNWLFNFSVWLILVPTAWFIFSKLLKRF